LNKDLPDIELVMKKVKSTTIQVKLCPRCLHNYFTPYGEYYVEGVSPAPPAISRMDNKTPICSECGQAEALEGVSRSLPVAKWNEHKYWEG